MSNTQIVRSYVRNKYHDVESEVPEQSNTMGYIVGGSAVTMLAIYYAGITLLIVMLIGALYGVRTIYGQYKASTVTEAVTAAPNEDKPKRHYARRITVNHYQLKKSVRI